MDAFMKNYILPKNPIKEQEYIRNKLFIIFLKERGNDLETVSNSLICSKIPSNNSYQMQMYTNKVDEKFFFWLLYI